MLKRDSTFFTMLYKLTIGGGVVFWATTFMTSLLPIAAKYRAAFSNWRVQTVWIASLPIGLIVGCIVSYFLLRFMDKNPTGNPILKSVKLSFVALVIAIVLVDIPQSFHGQSDAFYYFLIGVMFNLVRFLFLGLAAGFLCRKLHKSS
jgi:heme/copper-type cytochrome/quinol oxidase subunit 2